MFDPERRCTTLRDRNRLNKWAKQLRDSKAADKAVGTQVEVLKAHLQGVEQCNACQEEVKEVDLEAGAEGIVRAAPISSNWRQRHSLRVRGNQELVQGLRSEQDVLCQKLEGQKNNQP
ncbi:trichohyalin-like isoform X1 [Lates japonicus]|uniref:Trichohyalin-like isoform X1 n=1 Tax=Lates japonicus TaxID=270547 RepID=A0AAD3MR89_LATJO|nr:trichohyalin-like isoform X1 [Lates japonicus]